MLQPEQLIIGMAAGLMLSALVRFAPSWRTVLAAAATAALIDFAINGPVHRETGLAAGRLIGGIPVYPHICPCAALAFIGVLAVVHVWRGPSS